MLTEIHWWQRVHEVRAKQKNIKTNMTITVAQLAEIIDGTATVIYGYKWNPPFGSSIKAVQSLLQHTKLESVDEHHNVWWEEMKSLKAKHPHMVPFNELPKLHQDKHVIAFEIARALKPYLIYENPTDDTSPRPVHPLASGAD